MAEARSNVGQRYMPVRHERATERQHLGPTHHQFSVELREPEVIAFAQAHAPPEGREGYGVPTRRDISRSLKAVILIECDIEKVNLVIAGQ